MSVTAVFAGIPQMWPCSFQLRAQVHYCSVWIWARTTSSVWEDQTVGKSRKKVKSACDHCVLWCFYAEHTYCLRTELIWMEICQKKMNPATCLPQHELAEEVCTGAQLCSGAWGCLWWISEPLGLTRPRLLTTAFPWLCQSPAFLTLLAQVGFLSATLLLTFTTFLGETCGRDLLFCEKQSKWGSESQFLV